MSRRNRPSAYDVSSGLQVPTDASRPYSISAQTTFKRAAIDDPSRRPFKRRNTNLDRTRYQPHRNEIPEDKLVLDGEDPFYEDEAEEESKPIRVLSDFSVYDPRHGMDMISLGALEECDGVDRQFESSGLVSEYEDVNDEDAGQEADLGDAGQRKSKQRRVHLSAALRYSIDHLNFSDPLWIETTFAWYILDTPAKEYLPFFRQFYTPHRITQLVFKYISHNPKSSYQDFVTDMTKEETVLGYNILEQDILEAVSEIESTLEEEVDGDEKEKLLDHSIIKVIFRKTGQSLPRVSNNARSRDGAPRRPNRGRGAAHLRAKQLLGNIDNAVLHPENQTQTHVTPLIGRLAYGYFRERLQVVGARDAVVDQAAEEEKRKREAGLRLVRLKKLVRKAHKSAERDPALTDVDYERAWLIGRTTFLRKVRIRGQEYAVGDVILVCKGKYRGREAPPVPKLEQIKDIDTIPTYFWFAKIVFLNSMDFKVHVQWFEHSSATAMQELGHPQQLYLNDICNSLPMRCIIDKVTVHFDPKGDIPQGDFFYRSMYDHTTGTYEDLNAVRMELAAAGVAPDNCPVCLLHEQQNQESGEEPIYTLISDAEPQGRRKRPNGVALRGQTYHENDFVLVRLNERTAPRGTPKPITGPALIAQIVQVNLEAPGDDYSWKPNVKVHWLGRITDLKDVLPDDYLRDERHLYLTRDASHVELDDLLRVCHVLCYEDSSQFKDYLAMSPDHFYCRFKFNHLGVKEWGRRREIDFQELIQCYVCCQKLLASHHALKEFLQAKTRRPLRTLDLFGGVGAFALSMQEGAGKGLIEVTHAVEISPSAARTFQRNSPNTIVYNQCANIILRYCIKTHAKQTVPTPKQLYDESCDVAPPLYPEDIDLITIGFPCQSHSRLNMYKKANDAKSNLILTALSYIDFLRPDHCYFENVRGFMSFNLGASQAGQYRTEGGIRMGGLKFLLRALDDLGYQCRFALKQAAHYGAPQRRVRFFLHASKRGLPLPAIAQATHHAPTSVLSADMLGIQLPIGYVLRNINETNGVTPYSFVSINDAISDLPRFDWKHHQARVLKEDQRREETRRRQTIPAYLCDKSKGKRCGPPATVPYHHEPKTAFQQRCRARPTKNLQHFTLVLPPKTVERVLNIAMDPEADYRSLRSHLKEYQTHSATSAVARAEFRPGLYGRLNKDKLFQTTVTNITPTAKQSRVLHPDCKRMVTVRELARSQGFPDDFVFETVRPDGDVVILHRQIGNAVPWQIGIALGRELRNSLLEKWIACQREAISIDDD